jgi:MFS family permease
VYGVSSSTAVVRGHRRLLSRDASKPRVPRTVVLLGLTSLFTDISSEMVATVLPLYLVYVGGFSPLAFGIVDGIYNGATALVGLASGFIGDRWRRHKEVAATGYGLSALCKLLLAAVGTSLSAIGATVLLDRAGKGIRTAPRDAMISMSTPKEDLGAAFGVHRAMDTTGAMLGPLVAFGLLALAPLAFTSLFVVSFVVAIVGLAVLVLFVQPRQAADAQPASERPSLKRAFGLVRLPRYRALLLAGGALSLATASDAFVFLNLQEKLDLQTSVFPLLFVGSAMTFMLLAAPIGRLADRIGRGRVLLGGYGLLLAVYAVLLTPLSGWPLLVVTLGLLGTYYAATDGVLMAMGSAVVPESVRGSGLALLRTTTSTARLVASILFGGLWTLWGIEAAMACFAGGLLVAGVLAAFLLTRARGTADVRP